MNLFRTLQHRLGITPRGFARIESIHFESLTERTLVLAPGVAGAAPCVYLAAVHPRDGRAVGRWFRVAEPAEHPRYDERARRQRGRIYVRIPIARGDWLAEQLALRSRAGDRVLCTVADTHCAGLSADESLHGSRPTVMA